MTPRPNGADGDGHHGTRSARPFRARGVVFTRTQGCTLGFLRLPRWGIGTVPPPPRLRASAGEPPLPSHPLHDFRVPVRIPHRMTPPCIETPSDRNDPVPGEVSIVSRRQPQDMNTSQSQRIAQIFALLAVMLGLLIPSDVSAGSTASPAESVRWGFPELNLSGSAVGTRVTLTWSPSYFTQSYAEVFRDGAKLQRLTGFSTSLGMPDYNVHRYTVRVASKASTMNGPSTSARQPPRCRRPARSIPSPGISRPAA